MHDNDRAIVTVTAVGHAIVHTFELTIPIFVGIWMDAFGADAATIGLVVALGYGTFGVGALPGGLLTDAYGSKRLIVGCLAGMGGSFLLIGFVPNLLGLTIAVLAWGVAASVYHPAGLSLISTGARERGTAFGYHGVAGNVGTAVGPFVAAVLLVAFDWRTVAAVLALPALLGAALVERTPVDERVAVEQVRVNGGERDAEDADGRPSDGPADPSDGAARADGGVSSLAEFVADTKHLFLVGFALVFPIVVLEGLYYRGALTFLPDLLANFGGFAPVEFGGRSIESSRLAYTGLLTIGILGQYLGGKLTDRIRPERGLVATFTAVAIVSLAFVPAAEVGPGALLAVSAVLGIVLFGEQPLVQATVADYSPTGVRGLSYGYTYLGVFGVGALGAAMTGTILTYFSPTVLFLVLAGIAALAALLTVFLVVRN